MRIQHNIMAMSAYRNYNTNTSAVAKNLEKLSSGYKINRAGDDAAGLAISEKMRAQITGLNAAQKNVKDGISLVKTAEGAMQEIQDMLNRMDYLATQSANGTYDDDVDRAALQKEVDQLKSEINRIADSANFNGIKLLNGDMDGGGASTRTSITLPDVGTPIGDNTVLKDSGVTPGETVFDVQLDTLKVNAKAGDKLTVQIGEDEIELTLDEKVYSAEDLATALKEAFDAGAKTIDGQAFEATVKGTSVNFKQVNKPTSADDTVSAMMDVKISFEAAAGGGPVVLDAGAGRVAAEPATIDGTAGTSIKLADGDDTKTADASGLDKDAILAALDGKTIADGTAVTIEKGTDDKLVLKVGNETIGTSTAAVPDTSTAATEITFTSDGTAGGDALGTISLASGVVKGDITKAFETGLSYKAAVEGTDPAPGGDEGDGEETPEVETVASGELNDGGIDFGDATPDTTKVTAALIGDLQTEIDKLGAGTGKITIGDVEVNLKAALAGLKKDGNDTIKDVMQAIANEAKKGADQWNADNPDEDFTYTNVRVSTSPTGTDDDVVAQAAGNGFYILMDKTPKNADADAGDKPASVSGSYNAGTVKITQGAPEVGGATASTTIDLTDIFGSDIGDGSTLTIGKETYTFKWGDSFSFDAKGKTITLDKNATAADRIKQAGIGMSNMDNSAFTIGNENDTGKITIDEAANQTVYTSELFTKKGFEALFSATSVSPKNDKGLTLQIGDTSEDYNQLKVSIGDMHTEAMGIADLNIGKQADAQAAIQTIRDAINYVSGVRGDLGATQNRLEHTANNLSVMAENIQDAESTIRDTDIAEEMMSYTKNNILVQSAQAMLAQANQVPQGVLQLLG